MDIAFAFDLSDVAGERVRMHDKSKSILDLIFVSTSITAKFKLSYETVTGISDHQAVLLTLFDVIEKKNPKNSCFLNFSGADDTSIIDVFSFHFGSFSKSTVNVDDLWTSFKDLVVMRIDRFVTSITKKIKRGNSCICSMPVQMRTTLK